MNCVTVSEWETMSNLLPIEDPVDEFSARFIDKQNGYMHNEYRLL